MRLLRSRLPLWGMGNGGKYLIPCNCGFLNKVINSDKIDK